MNQEEERSRRGHIVGEEIEQISKKEERRNGKGKDMRKYTEWIWGELLYRFQEGESLGK